METIYHVNVSPELAAKHLAGYLQKPLPKVVNRMGYSARVDVQQVNETTFVATSTADKLPFNVKAEPGPETSVSVTYTLSADGTGTRIVQTFPALDPRTERIISALGRFQNKSKVRHFQREFVQFIAERERSRPGLD